MAKTGVEIYRDDEVRLSGDFCAATEFSLLDGPHDNCDHFVANRNIRAVPSITADPIDDPHDAWDPAFI
jgi:hypothetical protein